MIEKIKKPVFWLGILGALKMASDSLGYTFITDDQINAIANGLAALATVAAVIVDHGTAKYKPE